ESMLRSGDVVGRIGGDEFMVCLKCVPDRNVIEKRAKSICEKLVGEVSENIEKFELGVAVSKLYDFIWDVFCDWYIELAKPRLMQKNTLSNKKAQAVLTFVLSNTMKLLHPFMPFITEEIWCSLPHSGESIVISDYPKFDAQLEFFTDEQQMTAVIAAIRAVRNCRSERNVAPSKKTRLYIKTENHAIFEHCERYFTFLASATEIEFVDDEKSLPACVQAITDKATIFIPTGEMVDIEQEKLRLRKDLEKAQNEIDLVNHKLQNAAFVAKAPSAVVDAEKEKLKKYTSIYDNTLQALKAL
ncbi:MAG: class I tRNA ligase family protein, partial [Clostridia bacterium]